MSFETKDSGERVEFESGMVRDVDTGKTLWHLVTSGPMLERWAELLTRGAEKYDADNWMKASGEAEAKRFRESAFRHFMQWYLGEDDEDHAAAVIFNINGAEYVEDREADSLTQYIQEYVREVNPHLPLPQRFGKPRLTEEALIERLSVKDCEVCKVVDRKAFVDTGELRPVTHDHWGIDGKEDADS
jgi:hypothetical protein